MILDTGKRVYQLIFPLAAETLQAAVLPLRGGLAQESAHSGQEGEPAGGVAATNPTADGGGGAAAQGVGGHAHRARDRREAGQIRGGGAATEEATTTTNNSGEHGQRGRNGSHQMSEEFKFHNRIAKHS